LSYELWRNAGGTSTTYTLVSTYDGSSSQHTMSVGADSLVAGQIYKFKYKAVNAFGDSDFSDECDGGVSSFPATPTAPTKVAADSGETYITLAWTTSADTELPVIGYILNMDDGYGGDFSVIYNGKNYPNVLTYTVYGLNTGLTYRFTLQALNANGPSTASAEASFIICVAPTGMDSPVLSAVTKLTMTLSWTSPSEDGGCPITSYSIFINDGAGGSTFTEIDAGVVNNNPSLREHTLTFTGADTSKEYKFYMTAENIIDTVTSETVAFTLAATPDKPSTSPTVVLSSTTAYSITVSYAALSPAENGGSTILSYEVAIYNLTTGSWVSLVGGSDNFSL